MSRSVVFVAPNSYVIRNWLCTGLVDLVERELGHTAAFITPFEGDHFLSSRGRSYANHRLATEMSHGQPLPAGFSELLFRIFYFRIRLFAQENSNGSIQMMVLARKQDPVHYALRALRALAPRGSRQRSLVRTLVDAVNPVHPAAATLLERLDPQAVVVGSPGLLFLDQLVMIEAQRRSIPVHCVVNSWDNLTSRGPMIRRPASLMVWNQFMKNQAVTIHTYPAEQVHVVGSLQFTEYDQSVTKAERAALFRRLGLPPDSSYLLFLSGQHAAEYEAEDVKQLIQALQSTRFRGLPLVARLHPQVRLEPFQAITDERLILDVPPRFAANGNGGLDFGHDEIRRMAALLESASVVFSSWGTTALLEAAIFRKPIVQLRWMECVERSSPEQAGRMRDLQRYEHLKPFDSSGCRVFSDRPDDLAERIEQWFRDATGFRARCDRAVDDLATRPLGHAPQRVVDRLARSLTRGRVSQQPKTERSRAGAIKR